MPVASHHGIEIFYESIGRPSDPTVVLVGGLGQQLIDWELALCRMFVERGFRVVRFDNRDTGLSTHMEGEVDLLALLMSAVTGTPAPLVPYQLTDMAGDILALLDDLGVERAHVVGMSLGGMVTQALAIAHPERLMTMTSMMSTTGESDVGQPTEAALNALLLPPAQTREQAQDSSVAHAHVWGSPGLFDEARLREVSGRAWDRDHDAGGVVRQLAAILASGSRAAGLAQIPVPTLVIHGTRDELVQPSGGERTAEVVPDAKLVTIEGMGHDLPPVLWPTVVDAVCDFMSERG